MEKYGRARQATDGKIIRRMRIACWIRKATDTHSEYIILIAFPLQQWLGKRACVTMYIHCLSCYPPNVSNASPILIPRFAHTSKLLFAEEYKQEYLGRQIRNTCKRSLGLIV